MFQFASLDHQKGNFSNKTGKHRGYAPVPLELMHLSCLYLRSLEVMRLSCLHLRSLEVTRSYASVPLHLRSLEVMRLSLYLRS